MLRRTTKAPTGFSSKEVIVEPGQSGYGSRVPGAEMRSQWTGRDLDVRIEGGVQLKCVASDGEAN